MINIYINNSLLQTKLDSNLTDIIDLAGFSGQVIAVAVNGEFVPKSLYTQTTVIDKDNIDIVKPIGGG